MPAASSRRPENHLPAQQLRMQRRNFIRHGVAASALVGGASVAAQATSATLVPPWTRSLGAPVVAAGYGMPSKYEANVQRRQSPGLTPQPQAGSASRRCRTCSASSRRADCTSSAITRACREIDPAPASPDDPRPGQAAADLHDGRHHAVSVGVAHPLHRVRRQHRHGVGQRRRADRAVHARHARVQRVHRRAAVHTARRGRHRSARRRSSCWPKAPTARR